MQRLAFIFALFFPPLATAAQEPKDVPKDLAPFQGVWRVVKAQGVKGAPEKLQEEVRFAFAGMKLTIREGKGPIQEGSYAVSADASPAEIDLIDSKNKKVPGIYKFDADGRLTICFVRKPSAPRPKKFGETEAIQVVLERVKEKDKPEPKKEIAKDMVPFQGAWKVVKIEVGGKPAPGGPHPAMRFVFQGDSLEIAVGKETPQEGGYAIDPKKEPAEIDVITPEKKKIPGIYKFDKSGRLVISLLGNPKDPKGKRPTKFDAADAFTYVLEKAKE